MLIFSIDYILETFLTLKQESSFVNLGSKMKKASLGGSRIMVMMVQPYNPLAMWHTLKRAHSACATQSKRVWIKPLVVILDASELSELTCISTELLLASLHWP